MPASFALDGLPLRAVNVAMINFKSSTQKGFFMSGFELLSLIREQNSL